MSSDLALSQSEKVKTHVIGKYTVLSGIKDGSLSHMLLYLTRFNCTHLDTLNARSDGEDLRGCRSGALEKFANSC